VVCAVSSFMFNIFWITLRKGDLVEAERLVGEKPYLLDAGDPYHRTPLIWASRAGPVGRVRWLLDHGAAINKKIPYGCTALWHACKEGRLPVVSDDEGVVWWWW
jgi:ankyrin repeat protein